jgi:beta-apo-4'-carotenal oxygenase
MDIVFARENLATWMEDEQVPGMEAINNFQPKIRKEPIGTVLIIGYIFTFLFLLHEVTYAKACNRPYNFPIQLSIAPLIGAIASGCTAVVKPSEDTPNTSRLLNEIITKYLDRSCYICINGGIPETTTLLAEKWDKIFFTGSQRVGKIIAAKAALSLTPVTLELGGLNPAIVTVGSLRQGESP